MHTLRWTIIAMIMFTACATAPPSPDAPRISQLKFEGVSPSGASVSFVYSDQDGDITRIYTEVTVDGRVPSDHSKRFEASDWGMPLRPTDGTARRFWGTTHAASRCFTVWVVDSKGNKSNSLSGCFTN